MSQNSASCLVTIFTLCAISALTVDSARILAIEPFPSKSHVVVFSALTRELARRGHDVVEVSMFPPAKPVPNYTHINIMDEAKEQYARLVGEQLYAMNENGVLRTPFMLWEMGLESTRNALNSPKVRALLDDKAGFNLVLVEAFMNEAVYGFADHFKAPLVLLAPFGGFHFLNYGPSNPIPLSYIPNPMLPFSDQMTFIQRLANTLFTLYFDLGHQFYYLPHQEALRKEVFGSGKNVKELQTCVSLTLLNNHFSLNYPRPLVPAIVEVGGLHLVHEDKKLPRDIKNFLDESLAGVIYFSMGSSLRSDLLPVEKRTALIEAFAELPQRVLWKWESDTLPGQPTNVKVAKWFPQQDILAHPKVRLFITHGGLLSTQEAVFHGVPLLGIPVFGDQSLNMKKAEIAGFGLRLDFKNVTKESVIWAVNQVLHNSSYQRKVNKRSAIYRDQSETPLERAVFWTEYVLRHDGAPHLRSAATYLAWYQLYLLDVAVVLLLAILLIIFIFRDICKLTYKLFCKIKSKKVVGVKINNKSE